MPLYDLLNEMVRLRSGGKKIKLFSDKEYKCGDDRRVSCGKNKSLTSYGLGSKHENVYFTRRESECMVLLLKGKTISSVAKLLKLSPRTVEYYIKNMKSKLGCRTKFELIDLVYASDFLKNVDF